MHIPLYGWHSTRIFFAVLRHWAVVFFLDFFLKNLFDNSKNYIFAENYGLKRPFQNLKQLGNFKYNRKK